MNMYIKMIVILFALGVMSGCANTSPIFEPAGKISSPQSAPQPGGPLQQMPTNGPLSEALNVELGNCYKMYGRSSDDIDFVKYEICREVTFDKYKMVAKNDQVMAKTNLKYRDADRKELDGEQKRLEKTQKANDKTLDMAVKRFEKINKMGQSWYKLLTK